MKRITKLTRNIQTDPTQTFKELFESEDLVKVLYEVSKPYLTYQVVIEDDLNEASELYKAAMEMDIFEVLFETESFKLLFEMFNLVNIKGMYISHILVGDLGHLSKWLQKPNTKQVFNLRLIEVDELEKDVILFVASIRQQAEIEDFRFVVKGSFNV